jgi:hypothetical protein
MTRSAHNHGTAWIADEQLLRVLTYGQLCDSVIPNSIYCDHSPSLPLLPPIRGAALINNHVTLSPNRDFTRAQCVTSHPPTSSIAGKHIEVTSTYLHIGSPSPPTSTPSYNAGRWSLVVAPHRTAPCYIDRKPAIPKSFHPFHLPSSQPHHVQTDS